MPLSKRLTARTAAACSSTDQVAVKHADPAELRHGDRHVGFGHRVHRRGQDRDVERDFAGQRVRVSAWLGSTLDSSGCSSTSSKVSPSGISGASLRSAISAHAKDRAIRQVRHTAPRHCEEANPTRNPEAARHLDCFATLAMTIGQRDRATRRAASTCIRSIISSSNRSAPPVTASTSRRRALDLLLAGRKGAVAGLDLVRMDQAILPSKPRRRPSAASAANPSRSSSAIEHAVEDRECRLARAARTIDLQRGLQSDRRVRPAASRRSRREIVGPGDQRRHLARDFRLRRARPPPSRSSPAPACRRASRTSRARCADAGPRQNGKVALRSRNGIDIERHAIRSRRR